MTVAELFEKMSKADLDGEVRVYDRSGASIRKVFCGLRDPGKYGDIWNGRDEEGQLLPPGTYICKVSVHTGAETFDQVKTITVVY